MMVETCYGQKFERPLNDDFIESFNHRKLSFMYIGYVVNFSLALFTQYCRIALKYIQTTSHVINIFD